MIKNSKRQRKQFRHDPLVWSYSKNEDVQSHKKNHGDTRSTIER